MTEVSDLGESWTHSNSVSAPQPAMPDSSGATEQKDKSSENVTLPSQNASIVYSQDDRMDAEPKEESNAEENPNGRKNEDEKNDKEDDLLKTTMGGADAGDSGETPVMEDKLEEKLLFVDLGEGKNGQGDTTNAFAIETKASTSSSVAASPPSPQLSVYHIKWITWKNKKTAIITQNENGPCPLIAIMNVLILKGRVQLPAVMEMITAEQLMGFLGDCILDNTPQNISEDAQLNYEQNMHDAMAVFPKLQTGLDVNVKFTGVSDFEYTPECIIFDLLNIPLYHGWLVDPQNTPVIAAVGNTSYNQLVERIITDKSSTDSDILTNALIAESFLERTASQLTYHGLCELNSATRDDELAVLFRNNHFSMIYKYKNELFQLVTDQGFLTESNVIWETLSNIDGDGQFVDSNFVTVPPKPSSCSALPAMIPSDQQINQDYLVALSLQEEQRRQEEQEIAWKEYKEKQLGVDENVTDEELARRLQLEERELQADTGARREAVPSATLERHPEGKKKSDCVIL